MVGEGSDLRPLLLRDLLESRGNLEPGCPSSSPSPEGTGPDSWTPSSPYPSNLLGSKIVVGGGPIGYSPFSYRHIRYRDTPEGPISGPRDFSGSGLLDQTNPPGPGSLSQIVKSSSPDPLRGCRPPSLRPPTRVKHDPPVSPQEKAS